MKAKKLQFVWPKDGHKGRSDRGFVGGLRDIIQGKGPDIFLQREGSRTAILPEYWGNWDSYHHVAAHLDEMTRNNRNRLFNSSRGFQRYDPSTRRYTNWSMHEDWRGDRVDDDNKPGYPRFTAAEDKEILRRLGQGRNINAATMGRNWTTDGPRRFQQEYDYFWQNAHRRGENMREGFHPLLDQINPNLLMHQNWPLDLDEWILDQPWSPWRRFP